jgi:hypothetical protein
MIRGKFAIIDRRRDRHHAARADQERVAVGGLVGDIFGGGSPAGSRAVLDHDRLAEQLRQFLADQAGEDIVAAAGGESHDHADRLARIIRRRIGLRRGRKGGGRQQGRQRQRADHRATIEPHPHHADLLRYPGVSLAATAAESPS